MLQRVSRINPPQSMIFDSCQRKSVDPKSKAIVHHSIEQLRGYKRGAIAYNNTTYR